MTPRGERSEREARLAYATNAFPGETVAELTASVAGPLRRIAGTLGGGEPLGLEMRLSATAAEALESEPDALALLKEELAAGELEVVTFNAFSPSDFHARRVKEDAYRPTWLEEGRACYTRRVADIFCGLLREGQTGSLSTSPGSFKAFGGGPELLPRLARAYAEMADYLATVEQEQGRRIVLSIEPEPGCTIETTGEFLAFYEEHLLRSGREHLSALRSCSKEEAELLLRRHIAFTFDTAHLAVEFEDLVDSSRRLAAAGVRIGKVHATSAVRLPQPETAPEALEALKRFLRSPYMHQALGANEHGEVSLRETDLSALLNRPSTIASCNELRIHFHLPLYLERLGPLSTTSAESLAAVRHILARELCDTIVLETYTWKVLELFPDLAGRGIEASVAEEIRWARAELFTGVASLSERP